jgi:hypothetical protein
MIKLAIRTDAEPDVCRIVPIALGETWIASEGHTIVAYWTPGTDWVGDADGCVDLYHITTSA